MKNAGKSLKEIGAILLGSLIILLITLEYFKSTKYRYHTIDVVMENSIDTIRLKNVEILSETYLLIDDSSEVKRNKIVWEKKGTKYKVQ